MGAKGTRNRRTVWTIEQDEGLPDSPDTVELTEEQTQAIYDILASGQRIPPDTPEPAHEYVFLLTKSARYFYDNEAVREGPAPQSLARINQPNFKNQTGGPKDYKTTGINPNRSMRQTLENFAKNPGRNRRTVWSIATQAFSAAHFATFPTKLVEPMIKAGTSEKGCCPECGAPWERVTTATPEYQAKLERGRMSEAWTSSRRNEAINTGVAFGDKKEGGSAQYITTGWQPTCDCTRENYYFCPCTPVIAHIDDLEHGCPECGETMIPAPHSTVPCTVLDPFAGACTVGLVADRLGRDSIMIELNPGYAAMGEQRIKDDAGWVADVEVVDDGAPVQLELI